MIIVEDLDSGNPSSDKPEMKEKVRFLGLVKREWSKLKRNSLS
jgi:hypothetical protein